MSCALLLVAVVTSVSASMHIGVTQHYTICPGDTIDQLSTRKIQVWSDTIVYDTIITVASNTINRDTLIQVYDVNMYPVFDQTDHRRILVGDSLEWRDTVLYEAGNYLRMYHSVHGCDSIYRLVLETYQPVMVDTLFRLCDNETLTFHGRTYANAGEYTDAYTADTIYRITIVKHPSQLHLQTGTLDATHPFYWRYYLDGEWKTDTVYTAGMREYTTQNPETGCNDIWRLILTKDETTYHYIETVTVCENERFDWRGRAELNKTGVGQTIHYYDRYRTVADQDSIYELILTVNPVPRMVRTVPFCGSIEWNGKTYSESTTIIDTLTSVQYHCDSIVTTILKKGIPVVHRDTIRILTGETLTWHGQTITSAGDYTDVHHSAYACDSTFMLHVELKEPAHVQNTQSEWQSICQGDGYEWHNKTYYNSGIYYDTLKTTGNEIDSLFILYLTVNKTYAISERVSFVSFPVIYRDSLIEGPGAYEFTYQTMFGCDSIITSYIDLDVYKDIQTVTICPGQFHIWSYDGKRYTTEGRYVQTERTKDGLHDSIMHVLDLHVNYIPETYITHTMCQGEQYTFADKTLTKSGVYRHTFHSAGGCDSTVVLSLNVLSPDTSYTAIQREQGASYEWNGKIYREPGIYYYYGKSTATGCDSVAVLNFTYNQVDTIADTLTVCPNELPFVWNGIEANQTKHYTKTVQQANGTIIFYSLDLTVRNVVERDTTFVICEGGNIQFNGETYTESGYYRSYLSCDTLLNVHIIVNQPVVYETRGTLGGSHGYTWTYKENGEEKTEEFTTPGTYEYESSNPTTGCNDLYRLILSKDETSYRFEDSQTTCEGDEFIWHGKSYPTNITGLSTYEERYQTRTGKDSIYILHLTVVPVERTVRTIVFCGSYEWNGKTYSNDAVVYDTISLETGCYRIERINLDKAQSYFFSSAKELPQGEVYSWQGLDITTDGVYRREYTTVNGCDSIYEITVTIIPATPETNQYAEELSTCSGDTIRWRGKDIWKSGTYVDTVYKAGTEIVDSIFTLKFTAWPAPKDTIYQHMYTCAPGASIRYQGKDYYENTAVVENLKTIHGCDSIVKVFMHFNTAVSITRTDSIADTQLPYTWTYQLYDDTKRDTVLTNAGTYLHTVAAEGGCVSLEELVLVVSPTYLYELDTTVCETELPFLWREKALQHTIGETKQYEDAYKSVNHTDSIYRLNLTIVPAPRRTERISICENRDTIINGKSYFDRTKYIPGMVYRDTAYKHNADNECDSIIYYEISITPQRHIIDTRILHVGESFEWRGETIEEPVTKTYTQESDIDPETGCAMIYQLRVVAEEAEQATLCALDTPYEWRGQKYYTTGVYTDTIFDEIGYMTEYHSLSLNVLIPVDTLKILRGCRPEGVTWNGVTYLKDTIFRDTLLTCDTIYTVKIHVDTAYSISITDTICEQSLPYILGKQNPDTIWSECVAFPHTDKTACGCDSTVYLTLRIIPDLRKNDSTFICEDDIKVHPVVLGQLEDPWFEHREGGRFSGTWQGKWKGVSYTTDTIVYNCDSSYFHHIIVRPSQKTTPEKTFYLCPDDSLQLFWPYDTTWFSHDTVYEEHRPMDSVWTDPVHGITYENNSYTCDSVTRWYIKKLPLYHKDTTAHKLLGDSIWWGGAWRYYTGTYDSVAPSPDTNSLGDTCMYIYPLHLIMDTAYYFRDTVTLCTPKNKTNSYTWPETGHVQYFTAGVKDTVARHYYDSLRTYDRRDSIYDLCVNYTIIRDTLLFDTICEGDSYRFNSRRGTVERWLDLPGRYVDTLTALNGCDSIVTLQLYVRDRIVTTPRTVMITDRELPYEWHHSWWENGHEADSTDILQAGGLYTCVLPSIHGCDSIDSLYLQVHYTHVFRDTIDVCAPINKTLLHSWRTGYVQEYTTPLADDTAYYGDTLNTRIKLDSIYVLCVNFHQTYETHLYDTICAGDSVQINTFYSESLHPRFYKETGIYHDTVPSHYGCDSVITLHLQVWPGFPTRYTYEDINVRDTPYAWVHTWIETQELKRDTDWISIPGEYGRVLKNIHGCDSVDSLVLRIHDNYIYYDSVSICADETPYTWYGPDGTVYKTDIYETGEHIRRWQTANGFGDSTRVLRIEVKPILHSLRYDTLCYGDSILFGLTKAHQPRFLHTSGVYYDTLQSVQYGCDSIVEMRLNIFPHYLHSETRHIMRTDTPYVWYHYPNGSTRAADSTIIRAEGSYAYIFRTEHGCDSIDSLTVIMHDDYLYRDSVIICQDQVPYTWYGEDGTIYKNDIWESGEYTYSLRKQDGYSDSTLVRKVTVRPILHTLRYDTLCYGDSILFGLTKAHQPRFLHTSGVYYDTLQSVQYGCDSIVEMRLNIFPHLEKYHTPVDITDKELPYTWYHFRAGESDAVDSTIIHGNGTFAYTFKTVHGCDSVDHLTVIVHPNYHFYDSVVICSDATPYTWYGPDSTIFKSAIYTTDTYTFHMRTEDGYADSIYTRHVTVQPVKITIIRDSICADADGTNFYEFAGQNLTVGGVYRDTLAAENGCDSIVELHLTVNRPYYSFREEHIIQGQEVQAYGEIFRKDTIYTHKSLTPSGCDSTVVLKVVVHPMVDTVVTVCSYNLPYIWINKWNGQITPLYSAGIYRNDTTYVKGERMFYGLQLVVTEPVFTTVQHTICEGSEYVFHGDTLTQQGTYQDTLQGANTCDSIVTLVLKVQPLKRQTDYNTIFEGDSVLFYGEYYKQSGIYEHRETNAQGCDDVHQLVLTVLKEARVDTTVYVCENEMPYIWRGIEYNNAGDYSVPTAWTDSSRVVTTLHLNILPVPRIDRIVDLCQGNVFTYKGKDYIKNGIFYDTIPSVNGCDSILKYLIRVHPTFDRIDTVHISDKQTYEFNGRTLTKDGDYVFSDTTMYGCDSIHHLHLVVHPSYFFQERMDLCKPDTIEWRGRQISESGVYTDSLLTEKYGFDSVYQIIVEAHDSYLIREKYEIGVGELLKIHGMDISQPGEYTDALLSIYGCDSIFNIIVNPKRTREFTWDRTICQGEYYDFFGKKLTVTGKYTYTSQYKDSVVTLNLTVNPIVITEDRIVVTNKVSWPYVYKGKMYDRPGIFLDSILNQYGCFDIKRTIIDTTSHYSEWYQIPLCGTNSIVIDGQTITEAGLYTFVRRSKITGEMDSLYRVEVYNAAAYEFNENVTLCDGDTLYYGSKAITRGGKQDVIFKSADGCDSIYHLTVKVNPSYQYYTDATIADYETFTWLGKTYTQTGEYDRTWATINDCDSTYTLRLTVMETKRYLLEDSICVGQSYTWRGKTITLDGYYTDTVYRPETFQSAIYALQLTVLHPTLITGAQVGEICADAEGFDISFSYSGAQPTAYSIYFDAAAKKEGFKDIINEPFLGEDRIAHASMPIKTDVIYEGHTNYVKPDRYTLRLVLDNGVCGISRSDSLSLQVKYPNWIIEQNWGNVVAPLRKEYNGGYEFANTDWYVNGTLRPKNGLGYLHDDKLRPGDEVVMVAIRKGESKPNPSCPLIITQALPNEIPNPIIVYPTQAPHYAPVITIEAPEGGEYEIYSFTGMMIEKGQLGTAPKQITLPTVSGLYFIQTKHGHAHKTHKVMLY